MSWLLFNANKRPSMLVFEGMNDMVLSVFGLLTSMWLLIGRGMPLDPSGVCLLA